MNVTNHKDPEKTFEGVILNVRTVSLQFYVVFHCYFHPMFFPIQDVLYFFSQMTDEKEKKSFFCSEFI